nr:MAG TPA: hypothetical protein [Caudoviricetes sp.]
MTKISLDNVYTFVYTIREQLIYYLKQEVA